MGQADAPAGPGNRGRRLSFGEAVLDGRSLRLYVRGRPVELELKPLEALRYLLEHAGEAVSKDDLIKAIWPGRIISDSALTSTVAKLREALDDHAQQVLKTVHGFGYRLDAEVRAVDDFGSARALDGTPASPDSAKEKPAAAPSSSLPTPLPKRYIAVAAGGVVAAAVLTIGLWRWSESPDPADAPSLAILPFASLSADGENEYIAAGLHENLLTMLARISGLKVISRSSVMEYKGAAINARLIGEQLGVQHILEGSVQKAAGRIRVTVQLIDARTDRHLWAEMYDRSADDLFAMQSELAGRIVTSLRLQLMPGERSRLQRAPTRSTEAYEHYLKARALAVYGSGDQTMQRLLRQEALLKRALELDPGFAEAHADYGAIQLFLLWFGDEPRAAAAKAAAEKALMLAPELPDGHVTMAIYDYYVRADYSAALRGLEQAQRLAPGNSATYMWIAYVRRRQSNWPEAVRNFMIAADLNPREASTRLELADAYERLREYASADRQYGIAEALAPDRIDIRLLRAWLHFGWTGSIDRLRQAADSIPPAADPKGLATQAGFWIALAEDRAADAVAIAETFAPAPAALDQIRGGTAYREWLLLRACPALETLAEARACVERHRAGMRLALNTPQPGPAGTSAYKAAGQLLMHALVGDRAVAQEFERQVLRDLPAVSDGLLRCWVLRHLAAGRVWLGNAEGALDVLEQLVAAPCSEHAHDVRRDGTWRALRAHPRFQKLVDKHLPRDPAG